jgi:hypothetical protein
MFAFNPENNIKQGELIVEKNKNKQILKKLEFLIENDNGVGNGEEDNFYQKRARKAKDELSRQIEEIKSLNYEKALDQHIGYGTAEKLLVDVAGAEGIVAEIKKRNDEVSGKIFKHADRYGVDLAEKEKEFEKVASETIKEIDEPINRQRKIVAELQELLILDEESGAEYVKLLNDASDDLSGKEKDKGLFILDKASELLAVLPLSKKYKEAVDKLKEGIAFANQDFPWDGITWEVLPPGEISSNIPYNRYNSGEGSGDPTNMERVQFIENLKPEKILFSQQKNKVRNFRICLFSNCVVVCSVFACHAVYVLPRNNWEELSKKDKKELRFRGAIQLKDIAGWQEKLKKFVDGELEIAVDLESDYVPREQIDWGADPEATKNKLREKIFERFPDVKQAIKDQDLEKAYALLREIHLNDYCEMGISSVVNKFGNFRSSIIASFPEVPLVDKDFYISEKNFKWKKVSLADKIKNIREAVFSNFPEIEKAIKDGELESARIGLTSLTDSDFIAFGLRVVVQGKTGEDKLNTRRNALRTSFPEVLSSKDLLLNYSQGAYGSKEEKHAMWGRRLRETFIGALPDIEAAIKEQKLDKAKLLVISLMHNFGSFEQFTKKHNMHGIYGVADLRGGGSKFLSLAFPEIEWSDMKIRRNARKS